MRDWGARHLLEALQVNEVRHTGGRLADFDCCNYSQTITTLDLRDNQFGANGTKDIAKVLRTNQVRVFPNYLKN